MYKKSLEGKCPRCGGNCFKLGTPIIPVGKTRSTRITVWQCPNCNLLFYEAMHKE